MGVFCFLYFGKMPLYKKIKNLSEATSTSDTCTRLKKGMITKWVDNVSGQVVAVSCGSINWNSPGDCGSCSASVSRQSCTKF